MSKVLVCLKWEGGALGVPLPRMNNNVAQWNEYLLTKSSASLIAFLVLSNNVNKYIAFIYVNRMNDT